MNHQIPMNKAVRRKGVTIAAAALSVALVAPFAQSVAYPEISAAAQAQENARQELTLKRNPPVFYAEDKMRGTEGTPRSGSARHVRSTRVLADTYFPAGTKFELADPSWTFNKGGWFGWNKNKDGSIKSAGPGAPSEMQNPQTGSASPYVVEDTGQVLFGLGALARFGERMMIPMRARYSAQDPETGQTREYVWRFEQGIQVGDKNAPADASIAECAADEHWVNPPANLNQNILGHTMTKATQIEVQGQGSEVTPPTLSGPILSGQSSISGNADGTGALQSRRATITVKISGREQPLTTRAGIAGRWSVSLPSGETFKDGQEISVTRTTHDGKESLAVKAVVGDGQNKDRVAPPTLNPVEAGAETISGVRTGYAPVFVKFPGKDPIWAGPKEDHEYRHGVWSIKVPSDVSLKAGDKIEVTAGYGGITLGSRNTGQVGNLGTGASNYGFLNEVSGLNGGCYKNGETPKENPSQIDLKLTPEGDIDGQVGQPIDPVGVNVTNQPENTNVRVAGLPEGLTYNPETKQIEGTPKAKTPEGGTEATITLVDEQGNVVKNAAGQDVSSKIRVTISPEDIQPPVVSDTLGYPDETIRISADDEGAARKSAPVSPNLPDSIEKEDGDKYRFGNDLPEGFAKDPNDPNRIVKDGPVGEATPNDSSDDVVVTIDPDTGEITVEAGDKGDTKGPKDIPVEYVGANDTVKGKDSVSVDVKPRVDSPDVDDSPAQDLGYPGDGVQITEQDADADRTKKTGQPSVPESIKEDEGKFRFGNDLPEGFAKDPNDPNRIVKDGPVGEATPNDSSDDVVVTIDPDTGEITVEAGDKGDTKGPKDIPVEYVGANDDVKGKDSVSVDVKPRQDSDAGAQTPAQGLQYPEDEIVIGANDSGDQRTKESGEPEISDSVTKENDDIFRFHKDLPPGFERVNDDEARVKFDGGTPDDDKDDIHLTIDPNTGKVTVVGGENAKAKADIPVELIDKDGVPKDSGAIGINVTPETQQTPPPATEDEDKGLNYPQNLHVAPDNYKRSDSTGEPNLPESLKEDGATFRFGPSLPDGFVKQEPSWSGVEEIVREGNSPSERIVLRINKSNGKVEVQAGDASDYPLSDLSIEYVDATGEVKATDKVTMLVRPLSQADRFDPKWESVNTPEDGSAVTVPNSGDDFPADGETSVDLVLKPSAGNKGSDAWDVAMGEDGSITVTPGADAKGGDSVTVDVELTYPDGSTETESFTVTVPDAREAFTRDNFGQPPLTGGDDDDISAEDIFSQADRFDPKAKDGVTAKEGQTPEAGALINNKDDLPAGTTFEWDTKPDVSVPGKTSGVVKVNYPDGSSETVEVELEVSEVPTLADEFDPKGKTIIVAQGGNPDAAEGVANKGELPEGTEFEFDGPVDTSTPGEKSAKVIVAYPDGSTESVDVTVNVAAADEDLLPDADRYEPEWNDTTIDDSSQVTVENKGDELPHGTEVELGWSHGGLNQGKEDWDVDLEENGDITITPGADAQPGDAIVVEVELNYPDGTSETKTFVVQVNGDREEFVPGNFGALPPLTGDDNDDLTAGDVFTEAPTVNPVNPGDKVITGTGKPGATITVTGPNGSSTTTKVNENGNWSIDVPGGATPESQYIVSQKDGDKAESDQVIVTVGKGGGEPVNPGLSSGSSNFDIPRHLQCAVFAGGVTAIPLILLSPLHNMYELVMNPHLAGLREQFNREIHAIDQQVRRSLGVEGHPALQVLDHINGRVHQFNQQLGQFAHENRHIGLAAAAIAVAGLSYQHCMNTQANQSSSATGSSVDLSSSSSEQQTESRGIVGWFQGLFNRK